MNRLKLFLNEIIENYRKYFLRTYAIALAYTTICFIIMAILLRYSEFDGSVIKRQVSLISYIIARYSARNVYSLVDLSKNVLLFFISLFSVSFYRLKKRGASEEDRWSLASFIKVLRVKDLFLLLILAISSGADYGFFRLQMLNGNIKNYNLQTWIFYILYLLRIFAPLYLFALTQLYLAHGRLMLSFKNAAFLLLALWLIDQFAFEVIAYTRKVLFDLILIPFAEMKHYYIESILAIPLLAFFFISYHAAMLLNTEPEK